MDIPEQNEGLEAQEPYQKAFAFQRVYRGFGDSAIMRCETKRFLDTPLVSTEICHVIFMRTDICLNVRQEESVDTFASKDAAT